MNLFFFIAKAGVVEGGSNYAVDMLPILWRAYLSQKKNESLSCVHGLKRLDA